MGLRIDKSIVFWFGAAVVFFVLYSFIALRAPAGMFNSPDEMANHYFARQVAERGLPRAPDSFGGAAAGRVRPRSVTAFDGWLVPESFHGLPVLYGFLGALLGSGILVYLTPLLTALAVLAWRRVMAVAFGVVAGDVAALLLAVLPAWWYYANRGLYHNVLFTALLIFSAYFFIARPLDALHKQLRTTYYVLRTLDIILAGALLGLALWVRTAEIFWVALAVIALLVAFRKLLRGRQIVVFLIAALITFLPIFVFNQLLYGHPLAIGYTAPIESVAALEAEVDGAQSDPAITNYQLLITTILPFGFHPRTALNHFNRYFIGLPWWVTIATLAGLAGLVYLFAQKRPGRVHWVLILLFLGITGWLALVYGSWTVHDNPDPRAVTIGISYSRYWLPAFVLGTGIAGAGLAGLIRVWGKLASLFGLVFLLGYFLLSANIVWLTPGDGLRDIIDTLDGYAVVKADVARRIEADAVIVADRGDKIFFPDFRVMQPLRNEKNYAALPEIAASAPLYYYGITLAPDDERFHNEEKLPELGWRLLPLVIYDDHTLYKFITSGR